MTTGPESARDEGLLGMLRRLGRSLPHALATRIEILATELSEERLNLAKLAFGALVILFCLQVGILFGLLFFVIAMGNEHRLLALGIAAVVMLLGGLIGMLWLRAWLKNRPPMFATTVAELRKDRDRVGGRT
jgi:uncharacterized membrane protein YqjE